MNKKFSADELRRQLYDDIGKLEYATPNSWGLLTAYIALTQKTTEGIRTSCDLDLENYYQTAITKDHEAPEMIFNYVKHDLRATVMHLGIEIRLKKAQ